MKRMLAVFIVLGFFMVGCDGEQGITGERGVMGLTGPSGYEALLGELELTQLQWATLVAELNNIGKGISKHTTVQDIMDGLDQTDFDYLKGKIDTNTQITNQQLADLIKDNCTVPTIELKVVCDFPSTQ